MDFSGRAAAARILGLDCRSNMDRSRIGYMPENDSFVGEMTAVTFLRQMAELSGLPPKAARDSQKCCSMWGSEARCRSCEPTRMG